MNRREAIELQEKLFPRPAPANPLWSPAFDYRPPMLPEIVLDLRAAITGQSDPWPRSRMEAVRNMLHARLQTWTPTVSTEYRTIAIDAAVFSMVYAAVQLADRYLMKKGN